MKKPYKYGGKTVPGMFKAQPGGAFNPQVGIPVQPAIDPFAGRDRKGYTGPKRNWFGNIGTRIANIFRPSHKDMSPHIKGQYLNPVTNLDSGPAHPSQFVPGNTTNRQEEALEIGMKRGGSSKRKGAYKKGGSVGPNGML